MKHKMFISFILALSLLPLANSSCDPTACEVGISAASGLCQVGAGLGAASVTNPVFLAGFLTVSVGCAVAGNELGKTCTCASDDAPDFKENAYQVNGLKLIFQGLLDKLDGSEQNFQDIYKKLEGTEHKFKAIFLKLDGTEQNLQEIKNKLNGLELNFQEFVDKMDLKFKIIANKLDGIEQTQLENHLKQEVWFQQIEQTQLENHLKQEVWFQQIEQTQLENHLKQEVWFQHLVENDKNIILRQGKMIALQQTTVGVLDQLISTTETLGNKIEHSQIVTLYGQDILKFRNVRRKFKLLTRGNSDIIVNDPRAKLFRDAALHPVFGSETSINNIFLMLIGGHILKTESIYLTSGGKYCKPEVHKYFLNVLVEALTMHATALAMEGYSLSPGLTKYFNEDIVKATSAYNRHCDCLPGLKKANRGQVSTLLNRLPSSSQNMNQNRGQVARMENSVMRIKMDLIFTVKNFEPNEIAENVLENHSVEDIELAVASVVNKKEGDLELQDYADICVDKERNKVKTCAAFTQDSFVTSCIPPQTLEHGRFFCLEDGVTCHVTCEKGYALETTGKLNMFMECLDNTWTPLPTTFKCVPVSCRGGATLLSTSPALDMVVCKDKTESTCEKDLESVCPAGWNLCHPKQFNNRNHGWNYNWEDANAGPPLGVIYCIGGVGAAVHYGIRSNPVLSTDEPLNCGWDSSRPGCEAYAGYGWDCDHKENSALCCAPTSTCGDGLVQQEEDCDDGNDSNMDNCLNSCTWRKPGDHGLSGC